MIKRYIVLAFYNNSFNFDLKANINYLTYDYIVLDKL